ncbi:O-methyltransferase (modular protein) [Syntrophobacter sp. SbD2]|nr:O-methyltransferase (modular protein) [Syntrophobacter sp. SbD2]
MVAQSNTGISPTIVMRNAYAVYPPFAMLAGMELDLFTPLKDGPMDAIALSESLSVQATKLSPLLYALVAAGLLTVEDGIFSNTEEADKYLVRGRPDYMGGLSGFHRKLWHAAMNTAESIREGKPTLKIDWKTLPDEELFNFFGSQFHSSIRSGRELAVKLDFSQCERFLDAGGGTGGVSIGICEKFPIIRATVADLPRVARVSKYFIDKAAMSDRISVEATDLCSNTPPGHYDIAILRAFIQTISSKQAQMAVINIGQAMAPGGKIYIIGSILENSCLSPPSSLGMGLVFLNFYEDGKAYTEKEHQEMLGNAGFTDINVEHETLIDGMGIVSARKMSHESS